jgi:hypothetical protein
VFSVVHTALVATKRCGKHLCSSESARNNKGSGVFCGSSSRLYNEDLTQLELELSRVAELAVPEKIESSSGVGSCSIELS